MIIYEFLMRLFSGFSAELQGYNSLIHTKQNIKRPLTIVLRQETRKREFSRSLTNCRTCRGKDNEWFLCSVLYAATILIHVLCIILPVLCLVMKNQIGAELLDAVDEKENFMWVLINFRNRVIVFAFGHFFRELETHSSSLWITIFCCILKNTKF